MPKKNALVKRQINTPLMGKGLRVSTVETSSLIETVVLHRETGGKVWEMKESKTWEEAKATHKSIVAKWKAKTRSDIRGSLVHYKAKKRPG